MTKYCVTFNSNANKDEIINILKSHSLNIIDIYISDTEIPEEKPIEPEPVNKKAFGNFLSSRNYRNGYEQVI